MDKTQLVALIASRSHKLKALREQAANGNEEKKKLFMAALVYLLQEKRTHSAAYQQITEMLVTASSYISREIERQVIPTVIRYHSQHALDDFIVLWGKMLDGSSAKNDYPNFEKKLQYIKIEPRKELNSRMRYFLLQFQKNFNQRNDQRVEFFQDFDDSVMSESVLNQSQLMNIIYLSIMDVKAARKKLVEEKLTEEAANEQMTKLKHFLSLTLPGYLSEHEKEEFEKERKWAKDYLQNKDEFRRRNPSVGLNQTLIIPGEEEHIEIVKQNPKPRMFKQKNLQRQFFEDSVISQSKKIVQNKYDASRAAGNFIPAVSAPTPIKMIDPRYVEHGKSQDNSLVIDNGVRSPYEKYQFQDSRDDINRMQQRGYEDSRDDINRMQQRGYEEAPYAARGKKPSSGNIRPEGDGEDYGEKLMIRKVKPQEAHYNVDKEEHILQLARPKTQELNNPIKKPGGGFQDFSVTQNYFNNRQLNIMSPRLKAISQTSEGWGSPTKQSRFKLSQFTSEKKMRKETAPRNKLSAAQQHVVQPYLEYFQTIPEYALFRRNCFQSAYTIVSSEHVNVNCLVHKENNAKIRLELTFSNICNQSLEIGVVYKVPQCFSIEKRSKIAKRFVLKNMTRHIFCLGAEQFPIQPCVMSVTSKIVDSNQALQVIVPFSLTLLNFLEYEVVHEDEWTRQWNNLNAKEDERLCFAVRHIEMDRNVIGDEMDFLLRDLFVRLAAISGYSIQDYGCICFEPKLRIRFLLHLSVRVDNIVSFEAISCSPLGQDDRDFYEYCLNLWMMLLGKLQR